MHIEVLIWLMTLRSLYCLQKQWNSNKCYAIFIILTVQLDYESPVLLAIKVRGWSYFAKKLNELNFAYAVFFYMFLEQWLTKRMILNPLLFLLASHSPHSMSSHIDRFLVLSSDSGLDTSWTMLVLTDHARNFLCLQYTIRII